MSALSLNNGSFLIMDASISAPIVENRSLLCSSQTYYLQFVAERFFPVAPTSFGLKLPQRSVLRPLTPVGVPDIPIQLVYKPKRSASNAVAFLAHYVTKPLETNAKSVQRLFLEFYSAFFSIFCP